MNIEFRKKDNNKDVLSTRTRPLSRGRAFKTKFRKHNARNGTLPEPRLRTILFFFETPFHWATKESEKSEVIDMTLKLQLTKKIAAFFIAAAVLAAAVPVFAAGGNTRNAKKVLVVYYSATGTTERLANVIAKETRADLFALKPKTPYTPADLNWNDKNSRVVKEHELGFDKVSVELETTKVPNFESYDTVFIGYPIWWREAAWVVDGFVKNNNFAGKNVIAFCTSMSTGTGESRKRLERLAKTGNWIAGERFPSSFNEASVKAWLKGLGLLTQRWE